MKEDLLMRYSRIFSDVRTKSRLDKLPQLRGCKGVALLTEYIRKINVNPIERLALTCDSPTEFYRESKSTEMFLKALTIKNDGVTEFRLSEDGELLTTTLFPETVALNELKTEIFHALRCNNKLIDGIPTKHISIIQQIATLSPFISEIPKYYPDKDFEELLSLDSDVKIQDIFSVALNTPLVELSPSKMYVPTYKAHLKGKALEVYIPILDRMALLPLNTFDVISVDDLYNIEVIENRLNVGGRWLHSLFGKKGLYTNGSLDLINVQ